jgi:hypothetical protein
MPRRRQRWSWPKTLAAPAVAAAPAPAPVWRLTTRASPAARWARSGAPRDQDCRARQSPAGTAAARPLASAGGPPAPARAQGQGQGQGQARVEGRAASAASAAGLAGGRVVEPGRTAWFGGVLAAAAAVAAAVAAVAWTASAVRRLPGRRAPATGACALRHLGGGRAPAAHVRETRQAQREARVVGSASGRARRRPRRAWAPRAAAWAAR